MPFETNPQIERYLKDILYLHDEWLENEKAIYLIKEVLEKYEEMSPEENRNTAVFWQYLKNQRVAVILDQPMSVRDVEKIVGDIPKSKIIAVGRPHELGKPVEKYSASQEHWKKDIKTILHDISFDEYILLAVFDIGFIAELLDKVRYEPEEPIKDVENASQNNRQEEIKTQQVGSPDGTKWQDITIRFIDNGDNVEISIKKDSRMANFQEMGFEDTRKRRPNAQWQFLRLLADLKFQGVLSWDKLNAKGITSPKEQVSFKKKKQLLAQTLKDYFQIREDPFYSYKKEKAYRIKINLISSPDQQEAQQYEDDEKDDLGVKEYIKEHAPSVYEDERGFDVNN